MLTHSSPAVHIEEKALPQERPPVHTQGSEFPFFFDEQEEERCRKAQQYHLYQLLRQGDESPSA